MSEQRTDVSSDFDAVNGRANRFRRIQAQIHDKSQPVPSREDIEFLNGLLLEYEDMICWQQTCRNCTNVLNHSIAETERRERAEIALTSVRTQLVEARQPHSAYESDMVRRSDGRLTAYVPLGAPLPLIGDQVVLVRPPGRDKPAVAVLARLDAITELVPEGVYALSFDHLPVHDW